MKNSFLLLASSFAALTLVSMPSHAQTSTAVSAQSGAGIPVLGPRIETPPRALIAPSQTNYGLMTLSLGAQTGLDYNSNIYRSSGGEQSDFIATFSPKVNLKSNFEKHKLDFSIAPEAGHYFADGKNDYLDWDVRARGRYDASLTDAFFLDTRYRYGHVAIGSFEDDPTSNLKEPVTYDRYEVGAQWVGKKSLFHYETGAIWDMQDFNNVRRLDNTLNIQDDRDRNSYALATKLGYEFLQPYIVYLRGAVNVRDYDKRIDSSLLYPRDSDGYEVALGVSKIPASDFLNFDFYVGYLSQDYDAKQLKDVSGLDAKANVALQLTPADILEFSLDREIKDTNTAGVSSSLITMFGAKYTHEYNDMLSLNTLFSYTLSNYETNRAIAAFDREDHTYSAGLNLLYNPRKDIDIKAGYTFNTRESNQRMTDYDAHIIGLTFAIKY